MPQSVCIHASPSSLIPSDLAGGLAIVVDLIRASTTIVHALGAGAAAIIPCESIERAREQAAGLTRGTFLLGGERHGIRIEGFDLGNSPAEYTPARVKNKTIVFTTTNGTIALHRAESASRVFVGCFANLTAISRVAHDSGLPVHLVCAGVHGEPCREDTFCAGAIASTLVDQGLTTLDTGPTLAAIERWRSFPSTRDAMTIQLRASEGGLNLISAGLATDIPWCAQLDTHRIVPEWDPAHRILVHFHSAP